MSQLWDSDEFMDTWWAWMLLALVAAFTCGYGCATGAAVLAVFSLVLAIVCGLHARQLHRDDLDAVRARARSAARFRSMPRPSPSTGKVAAPERRLPVPGWCLLELRNRQVLGGYVEEVEIAGARFLELKVPDGYGGFRFSRFYNAVAQVASIIPSDELTATTKALKQWHGPPVEARGPAR